MFFKLKKGVFIEKIENISTKSLFSKDNKK